MVYLPAYESSGNTGQEAENKLYEPEEKKATEISIFRALDHVCRRLTPFWHTSDARKLVVLSYILIHGCI